jgi:hypothetical protein
MAASDCCFRPIAGAKWQLFGKRPKGQVIRKTGVTTIVLKGDIVVPGDGIPVQLLVLLEVV